MADKLSREELTKLLKTPLDPALDYYDATASIEAMAEHIRGLHRLIGYMFECLALQGQSIIDVRREIVEIKADLLAANVERKQQQQSAIIMPGKKKLEIN